LNRPAYDFVGGVERLKSADFFNRNFKYSYHDDVELNRKTKGAKLGISETGKNCTPAQLALVWLLAPGEDIVPIPGTKRRERLEENLRAIDIKLNDDDLRRIGEAEPVGYAAGTRYPQAAMHTVNR
jgi:aryl-alcohol dehydrogenase-like predicted oxidoreductase